MKIRVYFSQSRRSICWSTLETRHHHHSPPTPTFNRFHPHFAPRPVYLKISRESLTLIFPIMASSLKMAYSLNLASSLKLQESFNTASFNHFDHFNNKEWRTLGAPDADLPSRLTRISLRG
ncbi:unnamed protein product [Closterium sp. Yama58-4]|nr:unnamed protein product [Closterium sp. Yama58-4]